MSDELANSKKCTCGAPVRPGQRDCLKCHRERQARYRKGAREELLRLRALVGQDSGDSATRIVYDTRFRTRQVVVIEEGRQVFTGTVTEFLPFKRVLVRDNQGSTHVVKLEKLTEDVGPTV